VNFSLVYFPIKLAAPGTAEGLTPDTRHLIPFLIMQIGSKEWSDLIIDGAATFDISLDHRHTDQFAIYAAELVKWNQKINLTTITNPLEVAVKHFLDSLPATRIIPMGATLLDIGSGGGFPGLPLKILMPSLSVTLIDASRKKVSFLKHVIRTLKLDNIEALHIRAEDLTSDPLYLNRFNVIISRAVSSLQLFCRLALPLLAKEGVMVALKGGVVSDEVNDLQGRGLGNGGDGKTVGRQFFVTVETYNLPILSFARSIIIIWNH
jgi:16S rRNA (guanine527-N7)-methyltransferase